MMHKTNTNIKKILAMIMLISKKVIMDHLVVLSRLAPPQA